MLKMTRILRERRVLVRTALLTAAVFVLPPITDAARVAAQTQLTGIAAVVNSDPVTRRDLEMRLRMVIVSSGLPPDQSTIRRIRPQVLRNLIEDNLKLQEAKNRNVSVSPVELRTAMSEIEQRINMQPGRMLQMLKQNNIDRATLDTQLRADLSWAKLVGAQVRRSSITDEMIDERIARIESGKGKPEFLVSEIFVPFDLGSSGGDANKLIADLVGQIGRGADFGSLARTFSQSTSSAQGGNLGWVRAEQLDPAIGTALPGMKTGDIAGPIRATDGFYILQLRNRRASRGLTTGPVTVELQQVFLPLPPDPPQSVIDSARASLNRIGSAVNSCTELDEQGKELGAPQSGRLSNVNLSSLEAQIRAAIEDLQTGQVSQPIQSGGGMVLLMVCDRQDSSSKEEIRQRVAAELGRERAELISRRMLRNLWRQAVIDTR